ncbi:hypothetical protein EAW52_24765 [Pseudomonas sp. LTJR-52]|uniref:lecithin retinol acyltransferase family protein n=1 Tax=Pseudomonas sp. LTJR-52 TaxID=2479392 RepID=UPI000EFAB474|nr:lecithin retinol acyltransferase family protein [Pseudomonas sp. LTJR-52]AYN96913.1 hypothetical protein EAW52_24765 [Pseudomonas sp. LTJR-52]
MLNFIFAHAAKSAAESIIDNYIRDTVTPQAGCVVYCDLGSVVEHTGIYVGNGEIIHLDGSGLIEKVSANKFIRRLGGLNPAQTIYVSCRGEKPTGSVEASRMASSMLYSQYNYCVFSNNCHQFTSSCFTGNSENSDRFFMLLTETLRKEIEFDNWRAWDRSQNYFGYLP